VRCQYGGVLAYCANFDRCGNNLHSVAVSRQLLDWLKEYHRRMLESEIYENEG
jgi:hypothetical protein